jgi:outer membrane protein
MKKISLISNGVLLVAVIVLYVLHFSGNKSNDQTKKTSGPSVFSASSDQPVAYLEIDTVLANYKLYLELQDDLTKNIKAHDKRISSQMQTIEKEFQQLEGKRQNMMITTSEYEKKITELQARYQRLQQEQMAVQQQLMTQEQNANRRVINSISEYLDSVKQEGSFSMILGVTYGSVLYAKPELNITKEVLEGLNEEYAKNTE